MPKEKTSRMLVRIPNLLLALAVTAAAQWTTVPGQLNYVTVAPQDGTVFGITAQQSIVRRSGDQWINLPGQLVQLAAASATRALGVNAAGNIYFWNGVNWTTVPGALKQVSMSKDGAIWGTNADDSIYRFDNGNWTLIPGKLRQVAVGSYNEVWGVNSTGLVYRWNGAGWDQKSAGFVNIAVGSDASVWGVSTDYNVHLWNGSGWIRQNGVSLTQISAAHAQNVWGRSNMGVYSFTPPATTTTSSTGTTATIVMGPTTTINGTISNTSSVTPTTVVAPGPLTLMNGPMPGSSGQVLCVGGEAGAATSPCGTTKAFSVGAYKLDTVCKDGFYDMIYGGSCWSCPKDALYGDFIRSAKAVTADDACWRIPKEHYARAINIKSTPWPHECSSGTFWDPWDNRISKALGACYQCAGDTPRRTAYSIWDDKACASSMNETKVATLLKFNGCPAPDVARLRSEGKITAKERPGKPFLDIAGGWNDGKISGGCYACPIVDKDGNFLISERNLNPIYDPEKACNVLVQFKPAPFVPAGLNNLGAKSLILEKNLLNPAILGLFLHAQAKGYGKAEDSPEARAWVEAEWAKIAKNPFTNDHFRLMVLAELKIAAEKDPAKRTPVENAMIAAFEQGVVNWRVHLATQMLAMYDAWKQWDSTGVRMARSRLVQLTDYGTVPLDFQGLALSLAAPTAVGAGIAGTFGAAAAIESTVSASRAAKFAEGIAQGMKTAEALEHANQVRVSLFTTLDKGALIMRALQGSTMALSALAGPAIITAVFAIITEFAVQQITAIETARPKLLLAVEEAKKPFSLSAALKEPYGYDRLQ